MSDSDNLRQAKNEKNDEFYTSLDTIAKEVNYYKDQFKDQVVYCPCDSILSNFLAFFRAKFEEYELKKLVGTGFYRGNPDIGTFYSFDGREERTTPFFDGDYNLQGDLFNEADIVITNPPFSIFRKFMKTVLEYKKKFLILGSQNALSYNDIFLAVQQNKLWLGYSSGSTEFQVPTLTEKSYEREGQYYQKLGNICWFTNLKNRVREQPMRLTISWRSSRRYDNYDAIEVRSINEIPYDLKGQAGVPITFLNKFCPSQFKLIGKSDTLAGPVEVDGKLKERPGRFYLNGKRLYERIVIERNIPTERLTVPFKAIEEAVKLAKNKSFINNLRDRDETLRLDCSVRGFLGEILIKNYLQDHGHEIRSVPYTGGNNTDLIVNGKTLEVKTSLLPANETIETVLDHCDVKIYRYDKTDGPENMLENEKYRDYYAQIYYTVPKGKDYSLYQDCTYLLGFIAKEEWLNWLVQVNETDRTWSYGKKTFWRCPLYLCRSIF